MVWSSVELRTPAQVDALAGCELVAGDLSLLGLVSTPTTALSSLKTVDGVLRVLGIATEVALDGFVALEQVGGLDLHRLRPAATRHDAHRSSRLPAAHLDPRLVAVAARLTLPLRDGGAHLGQAPCALQQLGG